MFKIVKLHFLYTSSTITNKRIAYLYLKLCIIILKYVFFINVITFCIKIFKYEKHGKNNNFEICNYACNVLIFMSKRTTISLSDEELKQLRELAKKEHRPISRQIIYMMHFYIKQQREK